MERPDIGDTDGQTEERLHLGSGRSQEALCEVGPNGGGQTAAVGRESSVSGGGGAETQEAREVPAARGQRETLKRGHWAACFSKLGQGRRRPISFIISFQS